MTFPRVGAVVVALAVAAFVWPTPFESWQGGPGRMLRYRRCRFTGDVQRLEEGKGWRSVMDPAPRSPTFRDLPNYALAKVTASGTWSATEISFRVRNESAWTVGELEVDAWTYTQGTSKGTTIRRMFRLKASPPIDTYSTGALSESTDGGPVGSQRWNYSVKGARGLPPAADDTRALADEKQASDVSGAILSACRSGEFTSHYQLEDFLERQRALLDACEWRGITNEKELWSVLYGDVLDATSRALLALCGRERITAANLIERLLPERGAPGLTTAATDERDLELDQIIEDVRNWRRAEKRSDARVSAFVEELRSGPATSAAELEILRSCERAQIRSVEALRLPSKDEAELLRACERLGIANASFLANRTTDLQKQARALLSACRTANVASVDALAARLLPADGWEPEEFPSTASRDRILAALKEWRKKYGEGR